MRNHQQFNNLFMSSASSGYEQNHSIISSPMRESQHFNGKNSTCSHYNIYSSPPHKFQQQRVLANHSTSKKPQSNIYQSQIKESGIYGLERSKSQIIQPIYYSSFENSQSESFNESRELGLSKVSQVTFSKPSDFITNLQKSIRFINSPTKIVFSPSKNPYNEYGHPQSTIYDDRQLQNRTNLDKYQTQMQRSIISPMRQSCVPPGVNYQQNTASYSKIPKKNYVQNKIIAQKIQNFKPVYQEQKQEKPIPPMPQLRRALSNRQFFSIRSPSPVTKIRFNYISPSRIQNKTPRKLSFRKDDLKNPAFKILKNKKNQKNQIMKNHNKTQVINQYFPEFKIKRNKMKANLSPKNKTGLRKQSQNKSQLSSEDERRQTFIAGLQAFSQMSEIQQNYKEQSTFESKNTPKKVPGYLKIPHQQNYKEQSTFESKNTPKKVPEYLKIPHKLIQDPLILNIKQKIQPKIHPSAKVIRCRITYEGNVIQIEGQNHKNQENKETELKKEIQNLGESGLKDQNLKSPDEIQLLKEDSSHTTDYQDEIVKMIKNDLGLNYSYFKQ